MDYFEKIINDLTIIERYEKITEFEAKDEAWAFHNMEHIKNVVSLTEHLLKVQGYDEKFIEEAKIAAVLHDTGSLEGKKDHAFRSWQFAKEYFEKNKIELDNKELVLEAIKVHSEGFNCDNIIASALILADKLDIKHTRVAPYGLKVEGMRQLQYIEDISVDFHNNDLKINFQCHENLDVKELENFYFFSKVLKSIGGFSEKMSLKPKIFLNNIEWNLSEFFN